MRFYYVKQFFHVACTANIAFIANFGKIVKEKLDCVMSYLLPAGSFRWKLLLWVSDSLQKLDLYFAVTFTQYE